MCVVRWCGRRNLNSRICVCNKVASGSKNVVPTVNCRKKIDGKPQDTLRNPNKAQKMRNDSDHFPSSTLKQHGDLRMEGTRSAV